jgi:type II secretory pathway component PulF
MIFTPGQLTHRANFYFQLASLLSAGVPIMQALEMAKSNQSVRYRHEIGNILSALTQGSTFHEAINTTGNWLPVFDRALFRAGEQSGRLDLSLRSLGEYYKERATMLREVISGMAYPIFILHVAVFIFPTSYLTGLFLSNGGQAFLIQKLMVLLPCYAFVIFLLFAFQGTRGESWRAMLDRITSGIPILGSARRDMSMARLAGALEALIAAGVPIIQAWDLAAVATASPQIKKKVHGSIPIMEAGMTPSEVLKQSNVVPELFQNLYATGEASGQLDTTLKRLQSHYEEQATLKFQNLASWTPKLIFLCIALGVAYQIVNFYSGYFKQLNEVINF